MEENEYQLRVSLDEFVFPCFDRPDRRFTGGRGRTKHSTQVALRVCTVRVLHGGNLCYAHEAGIRSSANCILPLCFANIHLPALTVPFGSVVITLHAPSHRSSLSPHPNACLTSVPARQSVRNGEQMTSLECGHWHDACIQRLCVLSAVSYAWSAGSTIPQRQTPCSVPRICEELLFPTLLRSLFATEPARRLLVCALSARCLDGWSFLPVARWFSNLKT